MQIMQILYMLAEESEIGIIIGVITVIVAGLGLVISLIKSDEKSDEGTKKGKGKNSAFLLRLAVLCLLIAFLCYVNHLWMMGYSMVPNVVGSPKEEAIRAISDADFEAVFPENIAEDMKVIEQDPQKGAVVRKGSAVELKFVIEPTESGEQDASGNSHELGDLPFGTYRQRGTEMETINWKILDRKDGKVLLLSERALETMPFAEYGNEKWEGSSVQKWLNDDFLNNAFTEEEQKTIVETETEKGWQDRIFLLSVGEVEGYFPKEADRICEATDHVAESGNSVREINNGNKKSRAVWWWLRSMAEGDTQAYFVNFEGKIFKNRVGNDYLSVRPAMWIDWDKYNSLH